MKGGRVRGVETEGAETEGENQWEPSRRGRCGGGGLEGENQRGPSQRVDVKSRVFWAPNGTRLSAQCL
jgi:hypothetical protein